MVVLAAEAAELLLLLSLMLSFSEAALF